MDPEKVLEKYAMQTYFPCIMIHTVLIKTENMFIFKRNIILNIYFIIAGSELTISLKVTFIKLCNLLWQRNGAWCAVGIKGTFSITA